MMRNWMTGEALREYRRWHSSGGLGKVGLIPMRNEMRGGKLPHLKGGTTISSMNSSVPVVVGPPDWEPRRCVPAFIFRCAAIVTFTTFGFGSVSSAQTEKAFPTDDEIYLVLTQTERAIQQYKPLIDQEEIQLGIADAVANDRKVVTAL